MAEAEAIFIGANRQTHVSDVHPTKKFVAFGAGNTIALWNPLSPISRGVYSTLKGHKAEVTCVRFLKNGEILVSASEDKTVKVWGFTEPESSYLKLLQSFDEVHNSSIIAIGVFDEIFATGDSTGLVNLWKLNSDGKVIKIHDFKTKIGVLPLGIAIQEITPGQYLLSLGGSKFNVFIYKFTLIDDEFSDFELVAELEGHEDWVKALAFKKLNEGDYLLASGSQDRYIRLWRIRLNELIDNSDEDENKLTLLSNKQYKFFLSKDRVAINFEALIMGHDDWISAMKWHDTELKLLASSADTALMIWEPDEISGIWICSSRLGEISTKGASTATGSSGGFFASIWFNNGEGTDYILTNGKTGAWRLWKSQDQINWEQTLAVTGSTKKCTDLSWSINGEYLLSTSLDQTTRLYSQWLVEADGTTRTTPTWQEFARPQIHGYDMICISTLSNTRFISGGDEKILRSFDEPKGVAEILKKFCRIELETDIMPESASLPALGLSNKATTDEEQQAPTDGDNQLRETADTNNISYEILNDMKLPPFEDHLQRHSLWPEIEKLYGHGYEIISVDSSPDKQLIASSCRSNTQQHAVIRIFESKNWQELKPNLKLHNLTVTRVKFSPDNKYLLTVSRDRQYGIWERNFEDNSFKLVHENPKAHTRIIWDCSWSPLEMGRFFFTCSRDKSVKVWKQGDEKVELITSTKFGNPVTSIDVHKKTINNKALIAVGLEDGSIIINTFDGSELKEIHAFDEKDTPADRISRINWSVNDGDKLHLAVASHDHSTRIYSISKQIV
ncbi:elongator complex protein [Wickerhamomyces ciferrii]|uniref:Elongator complex protein 2 n=1 Tax=Wickerhamomyces ciferrii (strain ATCC 14091 / BCRC 22168 / CBS 111 / JCM 3599 / NBRC 0793 / NRRL Y-1031 F-60-10) TaxID=1206466 RepID=K0KMI6_WICCF|nr:elongator complex protein [Wickerhamomyces ciferrii]CCH42313.1 elongator complex protein [Wickerhamomyces ciferrii]